MSEQPTLRQTVGNAVASGQARSCTVNLTSPTINGSLLVLTAVTTSSNATLTAPPGFVRIRDVSQGVLRLAVWYYEGAPSQSTVTVNTTADRSLQVRLMEYQGAAQSGALDRVTVQFSESYNCRTGDSGTTASGDSIVVACVANQYASTTQSGFTGALTRLIEQVSPQTFGWFQSDADDRRSRLTIHQAITSAVTTFALSALLSALRHWIAILICFKGGATGPARLSSTLRAPVMSHAGYSSLTVFGPLTARLQSTTDARPMISVQPVQARVGPFNYQYRLGGWSGLLIGDGTPYTIESHEGLEGWTMRTSDDELPRGDGALRGVDLMSARQILFELKMGSDFGGALNQQLDVEDQLDDLYRALIPQRDQDWELIWRHPGRGLRMMRVRPTDMIRGLSWRQTVVQDQKFALIAADPRAYSAFLRTAIVRNTPSSGTVTPLVVINEGNGNAYPTIRISGPTSGPPLTRVELVNADYDLSFVVQATIPTGSTLMGDMEARATGAARSVVTIDMQSKYGAWQHPRSTWYLGPGQNNVHLLTQPAGAPGVTATLDFRDTWSG